MVTVLLPVYNAEYHIEDAIRSILAQTYTDFELLIINDGSTDTTLDKINSFNDDRIRLVNLCDNKGLIFALNYGLELARGTFIARMDADDICLPQRLEKQLDFLKGNPDYVACGTSIINFNQGYDSYMRYPESDAQIRVALTFFERNICHPTVMIRKQVLEQHNIRYRSKYVHAEDYMLWIDLSKYGKLYNLPQGLVRYHRHQNQVSFKYYPQQIAISRQIVTEQLERMWPNLPESRKLDCLRLCVHEQGIYPDKHFSIKNINDIISWILKTNKSNMRFDNIALKKLLYFKKFRCSFFYIYKHNYLTKLLCFFDYLRVDPKRAVFEVIAVFSLLLLKKNKK
ncbi:glycosyltransferase family 2 protein [Vibrio sp. F13]|uniref:glycosyltransferase family 2 protein n=1 Tax=Vibrio sp. F13 TaxID=2070777 RepID=UPI0010BD5019|nr:glycosyltransferase family A protein [Vibrio sp. F13]TKF67355.1 glycosyltransferase family 2 protein [Vibrio sp. F13]